MEGYTSMIGPELIVIFNGFLPCAVKSHSRLDKKFLERTNYLPVFIFSEKSLNMLCFLFLCLGLFI